MLVMYLSGLSAITSNPQKLVSTKDVFLLYGITVKSESFCFINSPRSTSFNISFKFILELNVDTSATKDGLFSILFLSSIVGSINIPL